MSDTEKIKPFPPIDTEYVSKAREKFGNDVLLKVLSNLDARAFYGLLDQIDPAADGLADALIFDYVSQVTYVPNLMTLDALINAEENLPWRYKSVTTMRRKSVLAMAMSLKMAAVIRDTKKGLMQGEQESPRTIDVRDALSQRNL